MTTSGTKSWGTKQSSRPDAGDKELILVRAYFLRRPDAVSRVMMDVAEQAAHRGIRCSVVCLSGDSAPMISGVRILPVFFPYPNGEGRPLRVLEQVWFIIGGTARLIRYRSRNRLIVVTVDTPSGVGLLGRLIQQLGRGSHVAWIMDLYAIQDTRLRLGGPWRWLWSARWKLDKAGLSKASRRIVLGNCMAESLLEATGLESVVAPMWAERPLPAKPIAGYGLRDQWGLRGALVILYSGYATHRHPLESLVRVVANMSPELQVRFVIVGQGPQIDLLVASDLPSVVQVHPPVSRNQLQELLDMADIHIVSLDENATGTCVPSKTYSAMQAGKPIIYLGDARGQAAQDILRARCGYVVGSRSEIDIAAAIEALAKNMDIGLEMGARAMTFARENRSIDVGPDKVIDIATS